MADGNLLAALLSGQDPLASQMVPGLQGAQLSQAALDPAYGHNEGVFGALAKTLAGLTGGPMVQGAVNNTAGARVAAQPELARLLASPDPYAELAARPHDYGPVASSALLNGANPDAISQARLRAAQGEFLRGKVGLAQQLGPLIAAAGGGAAVGGAAPQRAAGPAGVNAGALPGNGRYPQPQAASAAPPTAAAPPVAAAPDPVAAIGGASPEQIASVRQNPAQMAQILKNPQLKAAFLARLRALAQPAAPAGQ